MMLRGEVAAVGPLEWWQEAGGARYVSYRGTLNGSRLRLHYGFDGWREPIREVRLESAGPDLSIAQVPDVETHLALDCAVTDGERWDNNGGQLSALDGLQRAGRSHAFERPRCGRAWRT
jgi:Starch/carbohydrate-binding module (family 53)